MSGVIEEFFGVIVAISGAMTIGVVMFFIVLAIANHDAISRRIRRYIQKGSDREYVNKYCADCGHQKAIAWEVYKYDTNTGKPAKYRWWVYCPKCGSGKIFKSESGGKVTEYEYVNREYGVIPDTDKDKPDDRAGDMPRPLHPPGTAKMNKELWDNYETTTAIFSNWRGKRPDER